MLIRRIEPGDRDRYRSILEDTTAEDRYCRFFHAVDHFDPEFLDQYVDGREGTIGLLAFDREEPLGAAHAIAMNRKTAELAIVVARRGRRRGIARALLRRIAEATRAAGFDTLLAYSLRENAAFTALARGIGMRPDPATDGSTIVWRLDLRGLDVVQATRSSGATR